MATNNFKPFAIGGNANVTSQSDYEALDALTNGFSSGKASSAQINKAIRQSSTMSYVLAQFISDITAADSLDNGNPATLLANLKSGINNLTPGRLLNIQTFSVTSTYTKTPGTRLIHVKCWGAGGSGASSAANPGAGASGAGGGYAEGIFDVSALTTSLAVTVGIGGIAIAANVTQNGYPGGNSQLGNLIVASGGGPGSPTSNGQGGIGGTGANILSVAGQSGNGGTSTVLGGIGGGAYSSYGGLPHSGSNGDSGGFPGGGGAGGTKISSTTYYASGAGANGYIIVAEYA